MKSASRVMDRLAEAMLKVMNDPAVARQFADQQLTVMALAADAFAKLIRADTEKWGKVVKAADIKME